MQTHDTPEKTYDLERLIFFTDGVFAIVISLLVTDLRPPAAWDRTFAGLIRAEWRSLLGYAFSFVTVGPTGTPTAPCSAAWFASVPGW